MPVSKMQGRRALFKLARWGDCLCHTSCNRCYCSCLRRCRATCFSTTISSCCCRVGGIQVRCGCCCCRRRCCCCCCCCCCGCWQASGRCTHAMQRVWENLVCTTSTAMGCGCATPEHSPHPSLSGEHGGEGECWGHDVQEDRLRSLEDGREVHCKEQAEAIADNGTWEQVLLPQRTCSCQNPAQAVG